ncbi:MAG: CPBP family intramembrane metalloprotease [Candidatus Sumerlaeia bacterium]|nr:CPBP family intramembrane metalloprotease [Candidatus Sumerlaeia bacterium]
MTLRLVLPYLFWIGLFSGLLFAAMDCMAYPLQKSTAWQRYRPLFYSMAAIVVLFFAGNLIRFGMRWWFDLFWQAFHLMLLTALAAVFFCGGWPRIMEMRHVGLFEQYRYHRAKLAAPDLNRAAAETALLAAGVVAFSAAMLHMVKTAPSESFSRWLAARDHLHFRSGYIPLLILFAPIWEETALRWYLLNRIEGKLAEWPWGRPVAIIGTAALWALGHAAMTDPAWVKMTQIFCVGCVLGARFRSIGLSGCVTVHMAMNLMAFLSLPLPYPG